MMLWFFFSLAVFPVAHSWAAGDSGKAEIAFSNGLLAYKQKKYAAAETNFKEALHLLPAHASAAYFLGLSQYQDGRYQEAAQSLETAVRLNPSQAEPHFYRGVSLYHLKQNEDALAELEQAKELASKSKSPIADLAQSYARRIQEGKKPARETAGAPDEKEKRWFVSGSLTGAYDSNASLNPSNRAIAGLSARQSDPFFAGKVDGGYRWIRKEHHRLTTGASYYQSVYARLHSFNYGQAHIEVGNDLLLGNLYITLPAAYEFSLLGSAKYLQSGLVTPSISYTLKNRLITQLTPALRYDDFFQTAVAAAQNRDALNVNLQIAEYLMADDGKHYLKVIYQFENNAARGADWDYHAHTVGVALFTPFWMGLDLNLHANVLIDQQFENVDSVLGSKREDFAQFFGGSLSRDIGRHFTVTGHYDFYRNVSNQAFFTYIKHVGGVTLGTHF